MKVEFHETLKQLRIKEGLSQERLAEEIGVSKQLISNGSREMRFQTYII